MPSMFPSMNSHPADPHRTTTCWKPGDPTPRVVLAAGVLFVAVGALMLLAGTWQLTADWTYTPSNPQEAERMDFVRRNVHILGGINVVLSVAIIWLALSLRLGYRRKRRVLLCASCLAIFFMLAGWVFGFSGMGQALLALGLAVACLMAYRPSADPFFDAGHRLEADQGTV